jgi:SAM-dependent methyltransferase
VDPTSDPFATLAPFYDLDLEGYDEDEAWYVHLASQTGGPALELGCGTGRICIALAAAGIDAVGVDISAGMLARARSRVAGDAIADRLEWVEADLRGLDLGRRFALVLLPLGGLQHMETIDDVARALEAIARHLDDDGVAVIDVETPGGDDLSSGPQPLVEHWTRPLDGGLVSKLVAVEGHPALGLRDVTWHFDVASADGSLRRHTQQFAMRTVTPGEIELAARLAGLEVVEWLADYGVSLYEDGAERLVALLRHAGDGA